MNKKLLNRLKRVELYCFTPDVLMPKGKTLDIVKKEIDCGADVIQLREKHLTKGEKLDLAIKIRELTSKTDTLFIVNDDIDIAYLSNADGVHLGQKDIPPHYARKILKDKIIGLSINNLAEYKKAQNIDVDYLAIGPIFPTQTKKDATLPIGVETLKKMLTYKKKITGVIGGITDKNLDGFKGLNVDFYAIISDIILSENMCEKIEKIKNKISAIK